INPLGVNPIVNSDGSALLDGQIQAGGVHFVVFDGTNFQLLNPVNPVNGGTRVSYMETPTGVIDGTNTIFYLAHNPNPFSSCIGYVRQGGVGAFVPMIPYIDFTLDGGYLTDDLGNILMDSFGNRILAFPPNIGVIDTT